MKLHLEKLGTIGVFITAMLSPCCFPLFGFLLASLGFGSFELFGGWTMWVFQGLVILSLIGTFISYRIHKCMYPLLVGLPSAALIFVSYHLIESDNWTTYLYIGMIGLFISSVINYYRMKKHNQHSIKLVSTIKCPVCGYQKKEKMQTNSCQYYYTCDKCKTNLKPLEGDCCVFCSYGTVKCPPIQQGEHCC